ncbi:MAG: hypothetical protein ABR520_00570 [Mycobacteriales bacterium]|nr:hypothetical protein [Frankia sp.]
MKAVVGATVVLCLALPAAAAAAPAKPLCNLVVDDAGDAAPLPFVPVPADPTLDLLSGDVAGDSSWFTVVLRVADLNPTPPPPFDYDYNFILSTGEETLQFAAAVTFGAPARYSVSADEQGFGIDHLGQSQQLPVRVIGSMSAARNEIRMSVRMRELAAHTHVRVRRAVGEFFLFAAQTVANTGASSDSASGRDPYRVGARSCVKPGPAA